MRNDEKGREKEKYLKERMCAVTVGQNLVGTKLISIFNWVLMILSKKKLGVYD